MSAEPTGRQPVIPQRFPGRSVLATGIPGPAEPAGTALFPASDEAAHMTGGYTVAAGGYDMVGA